MVITQQDNGEQTVTGTALLLAAAPANKSCLIDATSVLPALAAVPPSALTGTAAATVVELADPVDPQTVLTRIRTAAAAPGPLVLYVTGQLHLDHRQQLLHLALARTTPSTLRYTALPWHWLTGELALRRPDTTTVVLDLVADGDAWGQVRGGGSVWGPGFVCSGGSRLLLHAVPLPHLAISRPTPRYGATGTARRLRIFMPRRLGRPAPAMRCSSRSTVGRGVCRRLPVGRAGPSARGGSSCRGSPRCRSAPGDPRRRAVRAAR
ncbi:hypothetical protein ACFQ0Q_05010 [Streptomyces aureus]